MRRLGFRPKNLDSTILVIALFGLIVRLYQLALPGHLLGVTEYDDGVYFGAALRLIQGVIPYKDYVLVQPSGIAVILSPIALLSKLIGTADALAIARVVTILVDVANVVLVGMLLRHKGRLATATGCAFLAFYPEAIASSQTVLLEPYLCFFSLMALLAIFDGSQVRRHPRRLLVGGLLFGVAGSIKTWAIIPAVVVIVIVVLELKREIRNSVPLVLGMIVGVVAILGPFVASAPAAFFHDVIYVQLFRIPGGRVGAFTRLSDLGGSGPYQWLFGYGSVVVWLCVSVLIVIIGLAIIEVFYSRSQLGIFFLVTSVAVLAALFWPNDFYYHYADFIAPYLALTSGYGAFRFRQIIKHRFGAPLCSKWPTTVGLFSLLLVGSLNIGYESQVPDAPLPMKLADSVIVSGACVVSDHTSLLIASDRFFSRKRSCPKMIDSFGTALAVSGGYTIDGGASQSSLLVADWLRDLHRADYVWLAPANKRRLPWTSVTESYFHMHFVKITSARSVAGTIFKRKD